MKTKLYLWKVSCVKCDLCEKVGVDYRLDAYITDRVNLPKFFCEDCKTALEKSFTIKEKKTTAEK